MKSSESQTSIQVAVESPGSGSDQSSCTSGQGKHSAQFMAARDSRNRRVPGIATRNGRFYAVLWADRGDGRKGARRFPLVDESGATITTLNAAKEALDVLKSKRRENALPAAGRKPSFEAYAAEYLALASTQEKRGATRAKERDALARWNAHLAGVRIDRIITPMIKAFLELRLRGCRLTGKAYEPASPRTVSLDFIALRNVLKAAIDAGHVRELPRFPRLKTPEPPRRHLITPAEFDRLLACCLSTKPNGEPLTKNGEQLRDLLRLLAFTGAREQEGLGLRWSHVDFEGRRVYIGAGDEFVAGSMTIGTGGSTKNGGSRSVDFNPQLESLLREIHARRAPDSSFLFPSPQRGERDIPAKTLRESFEMVRDAAGLPAAGFHDLRHLFCSFCDMAKIDFLTIAGWLGHKDGGILIGKVYGHLLDEHRQNMAARLTIGIAPVAAVAR